MTERNAQDVLANLSISHNMKALKDLPVSARLAVYLYVIARGAEVILDASCRHPVVPDIRTTFRVDQDLRHGLVYNGTQFFRPFQHSEFASNVLASEYVALELGLEEGRKDLRDYSSSSSCLSAINISRENSELYLITDFTKIQIRQLVVACDVTCVEIVGQGVAPPARPGASRLNGDRGDAVVVINEQSYSPLSTGPTLFLKQAFWWMFLPSGAPRSMLVLFRSLWIYKMKSLHFFNVGFFFNIAMENETNQCLKSSNSNVRKDMVYGYDLVHLVRCVDQAKCSEVFSAVACRLSMAIAVLRCMGMEKLENFARQLTGWMKFLEALGISEAHLEDHKNETSHKARLRYSRYDKTSLSDPNSNSATMKVQVVEPMLQICPAANVPPFDLATLRDNAKIDDVALIIAINYAKLYDVTPFMEFIQRQAFRHIDSFSKYVHNHSFSHVTFVDGLSKGWHYMYECVCHVMKLDLPVRGYLQVGDDILINTWNLQSLPRDEIWMPGGFQRARIDNAIEYHAWKHWMKPWGKSSVVRVFSELQAIADGQLVRDGSSTLPSPGSVPSVSARQFQSLARKFLENYSRNIGLDFIIKRAMDIFYIPRNFKTEFIAISEVFIENLVFIELALPIIHLGLVPRAEVTYISGESLWGTKRVQPWLSYNLSEASFLHPFKTLFHLKTAEGRHFFCDSFLPRYERWLQE